MKNATNQAPLFETPRGSKEAEKAAAREKLFNQSYGDLQNTWYLKLVDSGMDANQVFDKHGRHDEASVYDEAQEHFYANLARFEHVADESDFQTGHEDNKETNKRIWHLYAVGQTQDEISDNTDLSRRTVRQKLDTLTKRYKAAAEAGKLNTTEDTKAEVVAWNRLQAIGRKHLELLRSGRLGETIVDSVVDSECLVPRKLSDDAIEALNNVTASLALALGGAK